MATTGSLNTAKFTKGPGIVYLETGLPSADAALTLTAGVPSAYHILGYTTEGNTVSIARESEDVNADEVTAAIETNITSETMSIAGTAYQIEDEVLLQKLFATSTYSDKTTYHLLKFGGATSLSAAGTIDGALLVWTSRVATKYFRAMIYDAVNTGESSFQISGRSGYATLPYVLTGRPVSSRAAGDQIGHLALDKPS